MSANEKEDNIPLLEKEHDDDPDGIYSNGDGLFFKKDVLYAIKGLKKNIEEFKYKKENDKLAKAMNYEGKLYDVCIDYFTLMKIIEKRFGKVE